MGKIKEEKLTHYFLNNSNKKEDLCVKNLLEGFLLDAIYLLLPKALHHQNGSNVRVKGYFCTISF